MGSITFYKQGAKNIRDQLKINVLVKPLPSEYYAPFGSVVCQNWDSRTVCMIEAVKRYCDVRFFLLIRCTYLLLYSLSTVAQYATVRCCRWVWVCHMWLLVLVVLSQAQLFVVHIHTGRFKQQCQKFRMTKDHGGTGFNCPSKWCGHFDKWRSFSPLFSTTGYLSLLPEDRSSSSLQSTCCSGFLCPCRRGRRGERIRNPHISMNRQTPPTHALAHGKAHLSHCFAASEWAQINSVTIKGLW